MKADPQLPSSYTKYKNGLCNDCWAGCCQLPVEATADDLVRLGVALPEEVQEWSHKDLAKRLMKQRIIQHYDPRSKMFILEQVSGADCLFLHPKTRLCTVYEKRPKTCRDFPKVGPKPGYCPYGPK